MHGCFWHRHGDCPLTRRPKSLGVSGTRGSSRTSNATLESGQVTRLRMACARALGVQLKDSVVLSQRIRQFLEGRNNVESVELFTGIGSLAIAVSRAGFEHQLVVKSNRDACDTIRENQRRRVAYVGIGPCFMAMCDWWTTPIWTSLSSYSLVVRRASRSHSVASIAAIVTNATCSRGCSRRQRAKAPCVVGGERQGSSYANPSATTEYIKLQITYPELVRRGEESWTDHLSRLEEYHTYGRRSGLSLPGRSSVVECRRLRRAPAQREGFHSGI